MGNFGGGNFPQNNPPSLFGGGMHPQQRGQTGMTGMGEGTNPSFGMSNMQTISLQQQADNQFMMHRQGNVACFTLRLVELNNPCTIFQYTKEIIIFYFRDYCGCSRT